MICVNEFPLSFFLEETMQVSPNFANVPELNRCPHIQLNRVNIKGSVL